MLEGRAGPVLWTRPPFVLPVHLRAKLEQPAAEQQRRPQPVRSIRGHRALGRAIVEQVVDVEDPLYPGPAEANALGESHIRLGQPHVELSRRAGGAAPRAPMGISACVAVAVQAPAAGHAERLRPSDGAICAFPSTRFAVWGFARQMLERAAHDDVPWQWIHDHAT